MGVLAHWHMDEETYGLADAAGGISQGQQFVGGISDVGTRYYRQYNLTSAYQFNISWDMRGLQFQRFLEAWNDPVRLAYGNNWFSIDLPIQLNENQNLTARIPTTTIDTMKTVAIRVGYDPNAESGGVLGYRPLNKIGEPFPQSIYGETIGEAYYNVGPDEFVFGFFSNNQLPFPITLTLFNPDELQPEAVFPMVFDPAYNGLGRYVASAISGQINLERILQDRIGTNVTFGLTSTVDRWRRYNAHFNGMYTASKIGFNWWKVSATLDIDRTLEPWKIDGNA